MEKTCCGHWYCRGTRTIHSFIRFLSTPSKTLNYGMDTLNLYACVRWIMSVDIDESKYT